MKLLRAALEKFPRAKLAHTPTPLHKLPRLSAEFGVALLVKRDDCTGLAMGGNKARQLEFYLGGAVAGGCDTVISTGAVQSNFMRMLAAAAAQLGLQCHIQLEDRVAERGDDYRHSGNVLLDKIFGARLHHHRGKQNEDDADDALTTLAGDLAAAGKRPYIIPLGAGHAPTGALGYVAAAMELREQIARADTGLIVVGSGSGLTHAGLLTGLRLLGDATPVLGVCVRRAAGEQRARVVAHCEKLCAMLDAPAAVTVDDVCVDDSALAPGYGIAADQVIADLRLLATREGLLTDPVYSAKTFSCVFNLLRTGDINHHRHITVVHTGGTPALFAYRAAVGV